MWTILAGNKPEATRRWVGLGVGTNSFTPGENSLEVFLQRSDMISFCGGEGPLGCCLGTTEHVREASVRPGGDCGSGLGQGPSRRGGER